MSVLKKTLMTGFAIIALGSQVTARAASIETLVMPGQVTEAHAGIESECSDCHAPFSKTLQRDLCLACHDHKAVMEDLQAGTGFHGRSETVANVECATCHGEHEGRESDIVGLDMDTFDHGLADFVLEGAHTEPVCEDCHESGKLFREAPSVCFDCHEKDDSHQGKLGEDCGKCHQETAWQTNTFDHTKDTEYILKGAHEVVECALCHTNKRYEGIPTECISCHQIDDHHQGNFGTDCKQCHETEDWKKENFDHEKASEFALKGRHSEIECDSCHRANLFDNPLAKECVSCHLAEDVHQGTSATDCGACHSTDEWKNAGFDHLKDTDFPLNGAHTDLDCGVCHIGGNLEKELDTGCFSCHQVDDAHQEGLGKDCARCHQEAGWVIDVLFDHDLTSFPVIGLHSVAPCEACHLSAQFTDTPGKCVDCHGQDDAHDDALGQECNTCHNPNDWLLWEFDHGESSNFVLDGAHADITCQECHKEGEKYNTGKALGCVDCHRSDDVHSGSFGRRCARCHISQSFSETGTMQ